MTKYEELQKYLEQNRYTWLITGVAGFIGSNLLETLLRLNQKVVGLDNFETGYQRNLTAAIRDAGMEGASPPFVFIEGDVQDINVCREACEGVDFVLHQAALGSVPRSIEDPIRTNDTNINGFLNMLVSARDANVKRFVYAASSSTYGDHPDLPKVEDKIGNPLSPYAVTKLVNELYATVFARAYGFKTIGLRYFNVFGKRQDPSGAYAAVIPKWAGRIIRQEPVHIFGDGETSRDFCFVDNAVQMNLLAATTDNPEALDQIYNVALGDRTTLNELFSIMQQHLSPLLGDRSPIQPECQDFRRGDVRHSQADISKARHLLNYVPMYRIEAGLELTMRWYVAEYTSDSHIQIGLPEEPLPGES